METKTQLQKLIRLFTSFSAHFTIFVVVNTALWVIWLSNQPFQFYSWPVYVSTIWLALLAIHCVVAYEIFSLKKNRP